jgi:hypothetical protein
LRPRLRPCSRPTYLSFISKSILLVKVHKSNNLATSMTTKILFFKELLRRVIHLLLRGGDGMSLNLNHSEIGFDSYWGDCCGCGQGGDLVLGFSSSIYIQDRTLIQCV